MSAHVAIIGSALTGNKGAAAMLEATVEGLAERVPGVRFTLFSMYPDDDRASNRYQSLEIVAADPLRLGLGINTLALLHRLLPPLRSWIERKSAAIGALAKADVLLDQGGITFSDGREKFLLYNVASVLPALMMGIPVVKCAQAVGPFENRLNRLVAGIVLPKMTLIVTRGRITHGHAQALGLTNILAGADLAFTLDHGPPTDPEDIGLPSASLIGVSPSVVLEKKFNRNGGDYAAEMARFIEYLVDRNFRVLLLPHSARSNPRAKHNNDLPLCRTIYAALSPDAKQTTTFIDDEWSARALRQAIARCEVFVTSRFHAMVSGLATGTPTLVIGWSHKYQEVLEMFEAERWTISHAELSQACLRARFEQLWSERGSVAAQLADHLPAVQESAGEQLRRMALLIEHRSR
jgi:colanic acid/amylovoran biosynthesis protein